MSDIDVSLIPESSWTPCFPMGIAIRIPRLPDGIEPITVPNADGANITIHGTGEEIVRFHGGGPDVDNQLSDFIHTLRPQGGISANDVQLILDYAREELGLTDISIGPLLEDDSLHLGTSSTDILLDHFVDRENPCSALLIQGGGELAGQQFTDDALLFRNNRTGSLQMRYPGNLRNAFIDQSGDNLDIGRVAVFNPSRPVLTDNIIRAFFDAHTEVVTEVDPVPIGRFCIPIPDLRTAEERARDAKEEELAQAEDRSAKLTSIQLVNVTPELRIPEDPTRDEEEQMLAQAEASRAKPASIQLVNIKEANINIKSGEETGTVTTAELEGLPQEVPINGSHVVIINNVTPFQAYTIQNTWNYILNKHQGDMDRDAYLEFFHLATGYAYNAATEKAIFIQEASGVHNDVFESPLQEFKSKHHLVGGEPENLIGKDIDLGYYEKVRPSPLPLAVYITDSYQRPAADSSTIQQMPKGGLVCIADIGDGERKVSCISPNDVSISYRRPDESKILGADGSPTITTVTVGEILRWAADRGLSGAEHRPASRSVRAQESTGGGRRSEPHSDGPQAHGHHSSAISRERTRRRNEFSGEYTLIV